MRYLALSLAVLASLSLNLGASHLGLLNGAVHAADPASPAAKSAISAAVQPFVDRHELAGAVALVATKDKVLTVEPVGFADVAAKKPMQADSMFWIASQSKPITAATLMILVDEGKVSLDDPVEKFLPEFKGQMVVKEKDGEHVLLKKPVHPITVRNVLNHTSGLPFKSPLENPTIDRLSLADRVRGYAMSPLDFEPDSKYQYSNEGINVAARIVEVVSGTSFEWFLHERLLKPLGMNDTTFWPTSAQVDRIAKSYKAGPGNKGLEETTVNALQYPLTNRSDRTAVPAGGLFSTARDVARFYQMLLNGGELDGKRVLSEAAVKQLTSRQTPAELKDSYGLGFSVSPTTFGHGGAYSTNSTADRERGIILIWLVQHASFPGEGAKAQETFKKTAIEAYAKSAGK